MTLHTLTLDQITAGNDVFDFEKAFKESHPDANFVHGDDIQVSNQVLRHTLRTILEHNKKMASGELIIPKGEYRSRVAIYSESNLFVPCSKQVTFYAKGAPHELKCDLLGTTYRRFDEMTPEWQDEVAAMTEPYRSPEERKKGNMPIYLQICGGYATNDSGYVSVFVFNNPKPVNATMARDTVALPLAFPEKD